MRVVVSPRADRQLLEQIAYIAKQNPDSAERQYDLITAAIDRLAEPFHRGRIGELPGTRELVIPGTPFLAIFRERADVIEVLYIKHGRQSYERLDED